MLSSYDFPLFCILILCVDVLIYQHTSCSYFVDKILNNVLCEELESCAHLFLILCNTS
jgi:hypothetical protein